MPVKTAQFRLASSKTIATRSPAASSMNMRKCERLPTWVLRAVGSERISLGTVAFDKPFLRSDAILRAVLVKVLCSACHLQPI
jgi:hypothetical protein